MIDIKKMTILQQKGIEDLRFDIRKYLNITKDEYSKMVFDFGVEFSKKPPLNIKMVETKLYWVFINYFFLVHEGRFIDGAFKLKTPISERKNFFLSEMFEIYEVPKNIINELEKELKKELLKPKTTQTPTRTPKKKNNPLEINLNTI